MRQTRFLQTGHCYVNALLTELLRWRRQTRLIFTFDKPVNVLEPNMYWYYTCRAIVSIVSRGISGSALVFGARGAGIESCSSPFSHFLLQRYYLPINICGHFLFKFYNTSNKFKRVAIVHILILSWVCINCEFASWVNNNHRKRYLGCCDGIKWLGQRRLFYRAA